MCGGIYRVRLLFIFRINNGSTDRQIMECKKNSIISASQDFVSQYYQIRLDDTVKLDSELKEKQEKQTFLLK